MNYREVHVKTKYEAEGFKMLHNGAPDFAGIKTDEKGRIVEVIFVEAKSPTDKPTYEQNVWREIANFLGVPYRLEVVE